MKLTKTTDFALRLIVYLAENDTTHAMPFLSDQLHIPYNNLIKLVGKLAKAEIIETKQGKNGGVKLAKKAEAISFKDIIDTIDGPTTLSKCMSKDSSCELQTCCKIKPVISDIQDKINQILERTTIKNVIKEKTHV